MYNGIFFRIPVVVVPFAIIKNIMSCFDRIEATQILKLFLREEFKSVFTYWYMIDNCSCSSGIKQIGVTKEFKPWTPVCC